MKAFFEKLKQWWTRLWATAHHDEPKPVEVIGRGEATNPVLPGNMIENPNLDQIARVEPVWLIVARSMLGSKETDTKFAREMIPFWKKLFNRNIGAIAGNEVAWCGLFVGRCLYEAGLPVQKKGEMAGNWRSYGVPIDWRKNGIPQGAIIHINHNHSCEIGNKGNHVTFAATNYTTHDLEVTGYFAALGGNQGNKVCVASYSIKEICEVRWPKEVPLPSPVYRSGEITGAEKGGATT